jgi:predicted aspartyl protease
MPSSTGSFVKSGPAIKINISGFAPALGQDFEAIIDTGYTGFLSMPLVKAFPLGLILFGTTSLVLADGSTSYRLTAYGSITLGTEKENGVIVLQPNSEELLLGIGFLATFKKRLLVCPTSGLVELTDAPSVPPSQTTP